MEDRRVNFSRGERLFACNAHSFNQFWLGYTCMCCCDSTSINLGVWALFGKINFSWSAVDISICLHLSEWLICIFSPIPKVVSTLRVSTPKKTERGKLKKFQDFCPWDIESCHLATARCVKLWSLNANLFSREPHQLTKFSPKWSRWPPSHFFFLPFWQK